MISEISSYNQFNDLFRLNIDPVYDSDHEYSKDYQIDSIKRIRWDLLKRMDKLNLWSGWDTKKFRKV